MPPSQRNSRAEPPQRRRAFALIELLVVIGIITVLAALLLPALSKSKAQAYRARCVSNEKQLALTWHLYANDQNDRLVANGEHDGFDLPGNPLWVLGGTHNFAPGFTNISCLIDPRYAAFAAYITSPEIYKCPADHSTFKEDRNHEVPKIRSYAMNCYLGPTRSINDELTPKYQTFQRLTALNSPSPSMVFVFQDVNPANLCFPAFIVRMPGGTNVINGFYHYPSTAHNRAGVLAFADGHAETHHWTDPRTFRTAPVGGIIPHWDPSPENADLAWIRARTTSLK